MYDAVTCVPLIAWSTAGRFAGGRRVEGLCQLFDLGPTILELAGVGVPSSFEPKACCPRSKGAGGRRGAMSSASRPAT